MRRKDREITDRNDIQSIIKKCAVCRVAFFDEAFPYIVPLNFGYKADGEAITLYFHCAGVGKKLDLLRNNNHVAFEMDVPLDLLINEQACESTMTFESVCGTGTMEIVPEDEKIQALSFIMSQYSPKATFDFNPNDVKAVTVLKLTVSALTGKRLSQ